MKAALENARSVKPAERTLEEMADRWGLNQVYTVMERELRTADPVFQDMCTHVLSRRGKGLRPLLVLICSAFGRRTKSDSALRLAAGVEILHLAALAHDDVIDRGWTRRGQSSLNSRWDDEAALLAGDFFYGKSVQLVCELGSAAVRKMSSTIQDMVAGELEQLQSRFDPGQGLRDYLRRSRKKTGSLFSACCGLGAMVSGTEPEIISGLDSFGWCLGTAFQIRDDIYDWFTEEDDPEKPGGQDFRQGILTLPVLALLNLSGNRRRIAGEIRKKEINPGFAHYLRQEMLDTGALQFSVRIAGAYEKRGVACLSRLPEGEAKEDLKRIMKLAAEVGDFASEA